MERKRIFLQLSLLALAGLLIVMGISRGEMAVVLRKAANLCMECIGIG